LGAVDVLKVVCSTAALFVRVRRMLMSAALLGIDSFREEFFRLTADWSWEVEGFLAKDQRVHPIDSDTKVISTVFERFSSPVIRTIAKRFAYSVALSNQTTYPDFTLTGPSSSRIAIDIKTTYERSSMGFTLGGYNSFLRDDTKNILYPYSTYSDHWVIGFIYRQKEFFPAYDLDNMPKPSDIWCPYSLSAIFIRHKYEICGLRAGSGNTKNIGSVLLRNATDFQTVNGPFTKFMDGKTACDHYWRNYPQYVQEISSVDDLINHNDFQKYGISM
jgi:hypothetical protein